MSAVSIRNLFISKLVHVLNTSVFKMRTLSEMTIVKLEKTSYMLYQGSLSSFP